MVQRSSIMAPPAQMISDVQSLQDTVAKLSAKLSELASRRTHIVRARISVPALTPNSTKHVTVRWSTPNPPSSAIVFLEPNSTLLSSITATVGTLSSTGCTVSFTAPMVVGAGAGQAHIIAVGWM